MGRRNPRCTSLFGSDLCHSVDAVHHGNTLPLLMMSHYDVRHGFRRPRSDQWSYALWGIMDSCCQRYHKPLGHMHKESVCKAQSSSSQLPTHSFVSEEDVDVGHDLHHGLQEELGQERCGQVHAERLQNSTGASTKTNTIGAKLLTGSLQQGG